jgi:hypothetical protein
VSDLISTYYGQTLAYDEGLYEGDAILAAALWRYVIVFMWYVQNDKLLTVGDNDFLSVSMALE